VSARVATEQVNSPVASIFRWLWINFFTC
jgi:hypothetical protein